MCDCGSGVRVQEYQNTANLSVPDCLRQYVANREAAGLPTPWISVDECLADEIQAIWAKGIRTNGCCCGHNGQAPPYIGVFEEDIEKMRALGYKWPDEWRPPRQAGTRHHEHAFVPKSV